MNKIQTFLIFLVVGLGIVCIALIIALVQAGFSSNTAQRSSDESDYETTIEPEPVGVEPWERNVRLPKHLIPLHYELYLHPDLETGVFSGSVRTDINAVDKVSYILTHINDLSITSTRLQDEGGQDIKLSSSFEYKKNQFWVVLPETELGPGNYSLYLEFNGSLTKGIVGFYRSLYKNAAGEQVPIATSKFQPTYARKAFPCFDEPSFKSTFTTSLVRPSSGYIALSNMPEESSEPDSPGPGLTVVKFQKSVPMVTYLACFIVCDFHYQEKLTEVHNTRFRVYATPQQHDTVTYALDIGANITDYFTNYFGLPYPLPKQDMIAIPDFVSGAMEHWGLITYRETNLLYDPAESSTANKQRVAVVVSHELAHQWFGNLVTLEWWDDLWLNEGFASYMEYKGVANYHGDWEIKEQFLSSDLHRVLDLDATVNSHPIVQEVSHPDQITEIFDAISYNKGASVLRMLENFMGETEFQAGVHNFLEKYQYANAVTQDLWMELEKVSTDKLAVSSIMDCWTRQMGYPLLQVIKVSPTRYRVSQTRYLKDQSADQGTSSPYGYKWDVPLTWITETNPEPVLKFLYRNEDFIDIDLTNGSTWIKFNVGQFGFYRVNYPLEDWENLAQVLVSNPTSLSSVNRASLLNDAFSLAESGHIPYTIPLSMTKYMSQETSLVAWETVFEKMVNMKKLLVFTPTYPLLQEYIRDLVNVHYSRLGWKQTGTHAEKLNRNNIINLACDSGLKDCNDQAAKLFQAWIADPEMFISPDLRTAVYRFGMAAAGDPENWEIVFQRFLAEQNAQEKKKLLYGLAQVREPWILHRFLQLAKNESNVRSQDFFTVLSYVSGNSAGNPIVWRYMQEEWENMVERFSLNDRYLGNLPKSITYDFSTRFQLDQVKSFFKKYPEAGAGARSRKQAMEHIQLNIKWIEDHSSVIHSWLKNRTRT